MALSVNGGFGSKSGGSNPNLLDNGWFTVNQRGLTEYVSSSDYGVDRWRRYSSSNLISIESDGLHFTTNTTGQLLAQILEKPTAFANKTVTLSAKASNGKIKLWWNDGTTGYASEIFTVGSEEIVSITFTAPSTGIHRVGITNAGEPVVVHAIKLEYGSTSTLALDSAPDYVTELAKCRRHFLLLGGDTITIGYGFCPTNALARVTIPQMLTYGLKPTNVLKNGNMYIHMGNAQLLISAVSLDTNGYINCTISGATTNAPCIIRGNQSYGYIALYDSIGG